VQPLLGVPAGARRIEHARDHPLDGEALLRDLGYDQVRVVAVGGGDEHVGAIDPRLHERVHLERGANGELAAGVLPRAVQVDVEALVRERILVQDRHLVSVVEGAFRNRRPDASRTHDEDEHGDGL
jgi:hypothetical protein